MPEVKMKLKKNSSQIFPSPIGQHFSNLLGRSRKDPHSPPPPPPPAEEISAVRRETKIVSDNQCIACFYGPTWT
jgi:hypothetical protein